MADYFTLASLVGAADLTDDEVAWITDEINIEAEIDERPEGAREAWAEERGIDDPDAGFGFIIEVTEVPNMGRCMWLHTDENFNVANAAGFLQYWLESKRPTHSVKFEYANTCSKQRLDAFSGGAVYITKDDMKFMTTNEWLCDQGEPQ